MALLVAMHLYRSCHAIVHHREPSTIIHLQVPLSLQRVEVGSGCLLPAGNRLTKTRLCYVKLLSRQIHTHIDYMHVHRCYKACTDPV